MNTPIKGCQIIATKEHPHIKEGDLIGTVTRVVNSTLNYTDRNGISDCVIWDFPKHRNTFFTFGA
jgi:hypothetical protein